MHTFPFQPPADAVAKDPYRPLDYLVLPLAALRTATNGLPPDTLGILLQLLIRCAVELNSGRIDNAATTTNAPRCNVPGLWHWENAALILDCYPADYEAKTITKRLGYSANANARWSKSQTPPASGAAAFRTGNAIASPAACNSIPNTPHLHTPCMQLYQNDCNSIQETMQLHPCAPARDTINNKTYSGRVSIENTTETQTARHPATPPTNDPAFNEWKRALVDTHPAGKRLRSLPWDVLVSAWNAFQCIPDAIDHAPLLAAYMGSRLQKDKYGHNFFRSTGLARYFDTLPDHIGHAERWAIETGYFRKQKPPQPVAAATPPAAGGGSAANTPTTQELQDFFSDLKTPPPQQPENAPE